MALVAAFATATALGAFVAGGTVLLLYAGPGLLGAAGLLLAIGLGSLAGGLWSGASAALPPADETMRRRWVALAITLVLSGLYAREWASGNGSGRPLAVLLLLAAPAYAAGLVLAGLAARSGRGAATGTAAALGGGLGVLLSAALLIPSVDPEAIYFGGAALLALAGVVEVAVGARKRGAMRERVVLITGVGRRGQVGYAVAEAFLAAGARLVVAGISESVEESARELGEKGEVVGARANLASAEDAERMVSAVHEHYGRLDVLVNAAGGLTVIKPLAETTPEEWEREVDRNAFTAFLVSRAALPLLRAARGAIINFASPAGLRAVADLGAYSAAKAGVIALTRALALEEVRHGVRVNAVAPGMIDTEHNRATVAEPESVKWVTREQVASVVVFLASDAASGITGETIHVLGEGIA